MNHPLTDAQFEHLQEAARSKNYRVFASLLRAGRVNSSTPLEIGQLINVLLSEGDEPLEQKHADLYINWASSLCESEPETTNERMQSLLLSASSRGPSYSPFGVARLLSLGAEPCLPIDQNAYPLPGMRNDMYTIFRTPLSLAIDNGRADAVNLMSSASAGQTVAMVCVAPPEVKVERVEWAELDAMGFAIACGQTEIFRGLLSRTESNQETRTRAGKTVSDIVRIGLMDVGPDSVLGDLVTLIGWGADIDQGSMKTLAQKQCVIGNGAGLESLSDAAVTFPAMITLSTMPISNAAPEDALMSLKLFVSAGLDPLDDVSKDVKGLKLLHLAAAAGSLDTIKFLLSKNAVAQEADYCGKTPVDYATAAQQNRAAHLLKGADAMQSIHQEPAALPVNSKRRVNTMFEKLKANQQGFRP